MTLAKVPLMLVRMLLAMPTISIACRFSISTSSSRSPSSSYISKMRSRFTRSIISSLALRAVMKYTRLFSSRSSSSSSLFWVLDSSRSSVRSTCLLIWRTSIRKRWALRKKSCSVRRFFLAVCTVRIRPDTRSRTSGFSWAHTVTRQWSVCMMPSGTVSKGMSESSPRR